MRLVRVLPSCGAVVVGAASFALSYVAIRDVSVRIEAVPTDLAWLVPVVVDGGIIAGSALIWEQSRFEDRRAKFPFLFVAALVAMSVVLNVAHAGASPLAKAVAALPPLVLLGALELVAAQHKRERQAAGTEESSIEGAPAVPATPAPVAPPVAAPVAVPAVAPERPVEVVAAAVAPAPAPAPVVAAPVPAPVVVPPVVPPVAEVPAVAAPVSVAPVAPAPEPVEPAASMPAPPVAPPAPVVVPHVAELYVPADTHVFAPATTTFFAPIAETAAGPLGAPHPSFSQVPAGELEAPAAAGEPAVEVTEPAAVVPARPVLAAVPSADQNAEVQPRGTRRPLRTRAAEPEVVPDAPAATLTLPELPGHLCDAPAPEQIAALFAAHLADGGAPDHPQLANSIAAATDKSAGYVRKVLKKLRDNLAETAAGTAAA